MTGLGIGHDTDKKLWARLHRSGSIQGGEGNVYGNWAHIKYWIDQTLGASVAIKTGVPTCQVEDGLQRHRLARGGRKAESIC